MRCEISRGRKATSSVAARAAVENPPQAPGVIGRTARLRGRWGHGGRAGVEPEEYSFASCDLSANGVYSLRSPMNAIPSPFSVSRNPSRDSRAAFARRGRMRAAILPNACALCGNLSHNALCGFLRRILLNGRRFAMLRLRGSVACHISGGRRVSYCCGDCIAEKPPFDATFALADYRAPLDTLAAGLKFRAQLVLARNPRGARASAHDAGKIRRVA